MGRLVSLHPREDPAWRERRVLVVDDEEAIGSSLEDLLSLEGYAVTRATSGEEALQLLRGHSVALVISDQRMGSGMSGTALLAKVRERHPQTATMILSAYAESELVLEAMNEGRALYYLTKPWTRSELLEKVGYALRYYRLNSEKERLARANAKLLERMALRENLLMTGEFSTNLFERFFPMVEALHREAHGAARLYSKGSAEQFKVLMEKERWGELCVTLNRLRLIADFYPEEREMLRRPVEPVLRECVREAIARCKTLGLRVSWQQEYAADLPPVWFDATALGYGIKALIENAVLAATATRHEGSEAPSAPGRVTLRAYVDAKDDDKWLCIEVQDNGRGVPEMLAKKIFVPLFATTSASAPAVVEVRDLGEYNFHRHSHVGLGLPLAACCATLLEGRLRLLNPGSPGAVFRLEIPI